LRAEGIDATPPMDLSRPVEGGVARFRIVQLERKLFLCQHLTPELLWRPQWQAHANRATELAGADWGSPSTLYLKGKGAPAEVHGVRLEFD
jgi:hypothetical protein